MNEISNRERRCDKCGKKLRQREDDNPKAIKKRIEVYKRKTIPVTKYYKKKGLLMEVNANPNTKKIYKDIKKHLNSYKRKI